MQKNIKLTYSEYDQFNKERDPIYNKKTKPISEKLKYFGFDPEMTFWIKPVENGIVLSVEHPDKKRKNFI